MRKTILFCLLFLAAVISFPPVVSAQLSEKTEAVTLTNMIESSPSPEPKNEYVLPFPGMTPDHPLFFFKRLRDLIMDMLISDPVRKTEFSILKSDKYLGMAVILKEKNRWDLVEAALDQSNRNYREAVSLVSKLKTSGVTQATELWRTAFNSGSKHREVLESLANGATDEQIRLLEGKQLELKGELERLSL
jgi:hypothetical protein